MLIRRHHRMPALNTSSTADISFMLLIFFLVTTSMDVDKGITRQLPPVERDDRQPSVDVARSRVMQLHIGGDGQLVVDGKPQPYKGLRRTLAQFIERVGDRHLISVSTDGMASYDSYFQLQDELVAAYDAVRDDEARRRYHRVMAQCTPAQRKAVMEACPQHVMEASAAAPASQKEGGQP